MRGKGGSNLGLGASMWFVGWRDESLRAVRLT